MSENYKSYRIRTEVGQSSPTKLDVHLDQTYDSFEILSLKIDQTNTYNLYQSRKGIVVGRVLANGGVGVPNAKISIFIASEDTSNIRERILYPYSTVTSSNNDRIRYNLLPDYKDEVCHQNVGTFPNKRYLLDNNDIIEIFDKYWKYTTVTNSAGDYMLYGIPTGNQTLHMDVDLSDIGLLSQKPTDMIYKGYNLNQFDSPTKFKKDNNLNSLSQIKTQNVGIYVYPFWGDTTDANEDIAITRCDIQVDYKFEPTCVFIGSMITDTGSNAIGKNCSGTDDVGKMSDLVAGEGSIEMIRKTIDDKIEEFQIKGNRVIDGDGVWCYQIPMNLDYVMTDEFGNLVPTDNPEKGIPTRARVRFRMSLDDAPSDNTARKRCRYLVPNNPRLNKDKYPEFTADENHEPDYEFGTNTKDESFCDLFWNKVYTVKNYIPRIQKNTKITNRKHTGIKLINHYGDNNPMPYNNLSIKLSFTYRFICVLTKIFINLVGLLNNIITILGALSCKLAQFFHSIAKMFRKLRIKIWRFKICFGCPLAAPFEAAAKVFDLLTPPCIAISSEFCTGDVTHAYTFYPGCGHNGLARVIPAFLANCVWNKTRNNHNNDQKKLKNQEDRTEAINHDAELYNCVESQLAEDNDATSFNFQNDWINGTLYAPLWFRKITPKKRYFFGLIKRKAKDEWCSADQAYHDSVRIFHPCAVKRSRGTQYSNFKGKNVTPLYHQADDCGGKCHESKTVEELGYGLIRTRQTMLGQTVYYYKPLEYDKDLKDIKLLFATDIVLLGSINDCDMNGVPQFFKSLESSTYKLPSNMLFADNEVKLHFDSSGKLVTNITQTSTSEMAGNDWGNGNDDICGKTDSGLFYSIGCSTIEMREKSCINLSRICEFGVSLDETKQVPNLSALENNEDAYENLVTDGFISKDELYNDNERSMFATMNGNGLATKINLKNGCREYDFRHIYLDNFDNSLADVMKRRQRGCNGYTYQQNYNLEEFSPGYYDFRMGESPYYYDADGTFPRYENSFYFYFGLKSGKTAIDKFNSQFFAECHSDEEALSPIGVKTVGNSWCSDGCNQPGDGYVAFDLSKVSLPCDIIIQSTTNSNLEYDFKDVTDEKFYIGVKTKNPPEGYNGSKAADEASNGVDKTWIKNGSYTMTVTDADGEIMSADFDMKAKYLTYNIDSENFRVSDSLLLEQFSNNRNNIGKNKDSLSKTDGLWKRKIGGIIILSNITLNNVSVSNYKITVTGNEYSYTWNKSDSVGTGNGIYLLSKENNEYVFGLPKYGKYTVIVREICGSGCETNNYTTFKVSINDATPFKLFINDVIDYDVIKDWKSGWSLKDEKSAPSKKDNISPKWFNISNYTNYDWKQLKDYQNGINDLKNEFKSYGIDRDSDIDNLKYVDEVVRTTINGWAASANDGELVENVSGIVDSIMEVEEDFITVMRNTFYMSCPTEPKTLTFRSETDDLPVTFKLVYRDEEDGGDETEEYNVVKNGKDGVMTYSDDADTIDGIRIPTISTTDNENYGSNDTQGLPNGLCYVNDKRSNASDKTKYPYFVSVINNVKDTLPINVKETNWNEFFSFPIIDKMFRVDFIAWAYVNGIPYYKPSNALYNGKTVTISGLFAAKIYNGNGINSSENGYNRTTLTTAAIGDSNMVIYTENGEDDVPTKRTVTGGDGRQLYSYKGYIVNDKFINQSTTQYLPLDNEEVQMELDSDGCDISDTIYGNLDLTCEGSVDDCRSRKKNSKLVLALNNSAMNGIVHYYIVLLSKGGVNRTTYPLNYVENNKINYDNAVGLTFGLDGNNPKNLFSYFTSSEMFEKAAVSDGIKSSGGSDIQDEDVDVTFTLPDNDEQDYYVITETENHCRAISPVYSFANINGGISVSKVSTKIESDNQSDNSSDENISSEPNDGKNTEPSVTYETVEQYAIGFYVENAEDVYYLKYFPYDLSAICKVDDFHSYQTSGTLQPPLGNTNSIEGLFVPITNEDYKVITKKLKNPFGKKQLADNTTLTVTDKVGLQHICCIDTKNVNVQDYVTITYSPNGGYWNGDKENTADLTEYVIKGQQYCVCDYIPNPTEEMKDEGYYFAGWYEVESSDTLYPCKTDSDKSSNCFRADESKIYMAKWLQPVSIIWLADEENKGHFADGTSSHEQNIDDTVRGIPQTHEEPTNDQGWQFDGWECIENCDGVIISEDGKSMTTDHSCTVKAKWQKKWKITWISDGDGVKGGENTQINLTFNVAKNNGKWYDTDSTENYVMSVPENSTVSCDKIAVNQSPLIYGFIGWNTDSASSTASCSINVGNKDMTVYAVFKEKECEVVLNDVSTSDDNITLEVETKGAAGGTHFEFTGFTGESNQYMSNGQGTLTLNGITDNSKIQMYIAEATFEALNNGSPYANLYYNRSWHINEINEKLQKYNICYTDSRTYNR